MPKTQIRQEIDRDGFDSIMKEYTIQPFTIEWYNEAQKELNIFCDHFTRRMIMQLIAECDRQNHDCYICHGKPVTGKRQKTQFVITKNW